MKPKQQFRPSNLRALLSVLLVLVILGGGALFYWGITMVREYAVTVSQQTAQVEALETLKAQTPQGDTTTSQISQLFATPSSYQTQLLADVKSYASAAGLTLAATNFNNPAEGSYGMTVTLKAPVSYSSLIAFLNNIEGNIPKLNVSQITLGHVSGGGADSVKVGDIKIDIAVR